MCDNTNLPLALIMEEILEWEKPAKRDTPRRLFQMPLNDGYGLLYRLFCGGAQHLLYLSIGRENAAQGAA